MTQVPPPLPSDEAPQWWFSRAGTSHGPVSFQELVDKVALSEVGPLELVWSRQLPGWTSVERVPELATYLPPPNLATTRVHGHPPPPPVAEPVESPIPPSPAASTPSPRDVPPQAAMPQRVLARTYDFVFYAISAALLTVLAFTVLGVDTLGGSWTDSSGKSPLLDSIQTSLFFVVWLFLAVMLEGLSHFGLHPASRGKRWMGLEVRKANGDRLSARENFWRQLVLFIQGYGAGIPLALLVAAPYQLYRLGSGRPTTYDTDKYFVAKVDRVDWGEALEPLKWAVVAAIVLFAAVHLRNMLAG